VWHKDSERLQLALPKLIADNKKLRELTQQGRQLNWMSAKSQGDVAQNNDDQHLVIAEQAKLMNDLRRTIHAIETMKLHVHTDTPRPSPSHRGGKSQRRPRTSVNCYNCGQLGHIARNCQMPDGAIKKVEDNTNTNEQVAPGTAAEGAQSATGKTTNASANNRNVDHTNGGATSKLPQASSQNQHVRPIKDKEVKTCLKVRYCSYNFLALLDTGSDITIAGRDVDDRCGWTVEAHEINPIRMANDEEIVIDGVPTVKLKVGGTNTVLDVLVTRDLSGLILGIDWMTRQGPFTFDFLNDRVHFGTGKWHELLKESKSQMVRRCYVDHDTELRHTGQTEVDVRISRSGMNEPRY